MYKVGAVHPNVTTKQWKLVVTPLSGTTPLHQFEFEGGNWMAALRDARHELGEDGGLPSGASCTVAPDGTVTILDPEARRKFLLTPISRPLIAQRAGERGPEAVRSAKFQTVSYSKDLAQRRPGGAAGKAGPGVAIDAAAIVTPPPRTRPKRVDTADYEGPGQAKGSAIALPIGGPAPAARAQPIHAETTAAGGSEAQVVAPAALELLFTRDVDPTGDNPLSYRERAYLMTPSTSIAEAEAALRRSLAELQRALEAAPRGKFVNLAAFDHSWTERPQRPPLVALEWRDWRGDAVVDYLVTDADENEPEEPPHESDERLAAVFEALHELSHLRTVAEGLDFTVRLLGRVMPAEALSAALYDINTDELRFVAVTGKNAAAMKGKAVGRGRGLFGRATELDHSALVVDDVEAELGFDATVDGRPGLSTRNVLLRSMACDGRLLGVLQILNRSGGGFSAADVHMINYVAERLAEYLHEARARVIG